MMQRSHTEDSFVGHLEDADLDHVGERCQNVETADQYGKELCVGQNRHSGERRTNCLRAGISHEDLSRRRIPPQEPSKSTNQRCAENCEGKRITCGVASGNIDRIAPTRLEQLEIRDEGVGDENKDTRTSSKAVQAVCQVHCVRPCGDDEIHPDDNENHGSENSPLREGQSQGARH